MILRSNLPQLRDRATAATRVLDVGGWYQPFNLATDVIDLCAYGSRRVHDAIDPEDTERFSAATWIVHDVCSSPWPYDDKSFDFVICSNLLEDVRDPIGVCRELCRVGKAGYIETPSRVREVFSKERWFLLKSFLGKMPEIGFYHHRWFVEGEGTHLRFTAKTAALSESRGNYITRGDIGRKLTEKESGFALFWVEGFTYEEIFTDLRSDYALFRRRAMDELKR
jgi:SAM-dependent methyltransferase